MDVWKCGECCSGYALDGGFLVRVCILSKEYVVRDEMGLFRQEMWVLVARRQGFPLTESLCVGKEVSVGGVRHLYR